MCSKFEWGQIPNSTKPDNDNSTAAAGDDDADERAASGRLRSAKPTRASRLAFESASGRNQVYRASCVRRGGAVAAPRADRSFYSSPMQSSQPTSQSAVGSGLRRTSSIAPSRNPRAPPRTYLYDHIARSTEREHIRHWSLIRIT